MITAVSLGRTSAPPPRPLDQNPQLRGAFVSPDDDRVIVLPPEKPFKKDPVSGSSGARGAIAGSIAGALSGTYTAVLMLQSHPTAAVGCMLGCTALGALVGYLATK